MAFTYPITISKLCYFSFSHSGTAPALAIIWDGYNAYFNAYSYLFARTYWHDGNFMNDDTPYVIFAVGW